MIAATGTLFRDGVRDEFLIARPGAKRRAGGTLLGLLYEDSKLWAEPLNGFDAYCA